MQHPTSEKDMNYSQNAFESDMKNFLIKISVVMKIAFQTLLWKSIFMFHFTRKFQGVIQ